MTRLKRSPPTPGSRRNAARDVRAARLGGRCGRGGLVMLLREFGFSDGAGCAAPTRLVRRDLIAPREVRATRALQPDPAVRAAADRGRRPDLHAGPAPREHRPGAWTVLWHQIPEDRRLERARLGRRLRFLGFGSVQDSVWVSPHDHRDEVAQLLVELGVNEQRDCVRVIARERLHGGGLPALVAAGVGSERARGPLCARSARDSNRYLAPDPRRRSLTATRSSSALG